MVISGQYFGGFWQKAREKTQGNGFEMTLKSRETNEKRQNENWGYNQHTKYEFPSPHRTRTMTTKIWPCTTNANYSASYAKDVKVEGECSN